MAGVPLATAFVRIRPDLRTFRTETQAGISKSGLGATATKHGKEFGQKFGKSAASWIGSTIGFVGAAAAVTTVYKAMVSLQTETRLVSNAIKATGGAAGVTTRQAVNLAAGISSYSGQSKIAVLQAEKLLLAFTNVRNEAGKGNDIYNRSVKALADLAAATGRDVPSAARMLGKALQDPLTGLTALRRAGVVFTAQQTDQIKKMTANGNLMGAQRMILDQLAQRYGGAARAAGSTFGGQMNRLRNTLVGFGVVAMQIVLPFVQKLVAGFLRLPRFTQQVIVAVTALGVALRVAGMSNPFTLIATAVITLAMIIIRYRKQIAAAFQAAWAAIKASFDAVWSWIKGHWPLLLTILTGPIGAAAAFIIRHWDTVRSMFRGFINFLLGIFGQILHGAAVAFGWIPGLGGKLKAADAAFQRFRDRVNAALGGINGRTVNVGVRMTAASNPYPGGISGRAAKGLYVKAGTGPTADDVLIRASRGELVVPANMVRSGAVDHLRGTIPGFASGGVVVRASTPSAGVINRTLMAPIDALAKAFAKGLLMAARSGGGGGYGGYGVPPRGPLQAYAMALLKARGWGNQWAAFNSLVMGESGWNPYATNPSSGAYGIPQALPPGKMASAGADWRTSGYTQLRWMMGYIASVYGSPARAWSMWQSRSPHWYGAGGTLTEPVLGIGLRSGRGYGLAERGPETVTPAADIKALIKAVRAMHADLLHATQKAPARTAAGVHEALTRAGRPAAYTGIYGR